MFNLTSQEQKAVVFVLVFLMVGIGLEFYKKSNNRDNLLSFDTLEQQLFDKVDINKATVLELANIPGVGENLAYSIVDYRKSNGNFKNIEDLKKVKGIKNKKLEQLRRYITLEDPSK
jgi:comEA protein